MSTQSNCVFCRIAAYQEPAKVWYVDNDIIVIKNRLNWVPVMLLAMPKRHMTQAELWRDLGEVGEVAIAVAEEHCSGGYRMLSNFGYNGMQSQDHAHVHILGGQFLGEYA